MSKPKQSKKTRSRKEKPLFTQYSTIIGFSITACLLIAFFTVLTHIINNPSQTSVLGAHTYLADSNSGSEQDTPEHAKLSESKNTPEVSKEIQRVQNEVNTELKNNSLGNVEIQAPSEGSSSGKVFLQNDTTGAQKELPLPAGNEQITQLSSPQAGTVSVRVSGPNTINIQNGAYSAATSYPVVVNPKTQSIALKTPSGQVAVKSLPSQAVSSLLQHNPLASISAITLTVQNGAPVYQASGDVTKKLLGIIPVTGNIQETINAQTGNIVSSHTPWYFSLFGFAFQNS